MNPQLTLATNRQFWAGVGATIVVGIFVAVVLPNLLRSRMSFYETKQVSSRLGTAIDGYAGSGGGDRERIGC